SGVVMAQVLQKIDLVYFNDNWINRIKSEVGDNWRLKVSNLKKILKGILDYNHEILGQQINDFTLPDVSLIGEHSDPAELGRMLQLILGCAVNCEQKQEYIQTIMMMEESVQHVVMTAIQELMSKETPVTGGNDSYADLDRQLKKTMEDLNDALATKEEIAQRCHELDMQVAALQEEKSSLLAENQVLMERLNQTDSIEDPNSPVGRRHLQLQTQLEQLQEETFRLEAAKDDYRIRCEELEKELMELRGQNEELTSLADEAQSLKDEMDVLRHSSDKVSKLEGMVDSYKKKLEDLGDLRRQVKLLEEKNTVYMQNTVSLEEELRKANATRGQLETYKRQVVELQNRLSEESKKADKMEFEYKRLKEKVDSLQKEKDVSVSTLQSLSEDMDRLIRLQHENKMLKLNQEGSDNEQIALLQSLLEDANSRKNELETENRLLEGQGQVEELHKALQEQGLKSDDVSTQSYLILCLVTYVILCRQVQTGDVKRSKLNHMLQKIEELEEALKKKDDDMKQMEERYKKYLEKAKSVNIQAFSFLLLYLMCCCFIKEYDKTKTQRDQEEKLVVSAWYNMVSKTETLISLSKNIKLGQGLALWVRKQTRTLGAVVSRDN
uniref:Calponin-homology (CH) domain-containing protein n=1 Tax=Denticeps clupeoides TaxID=299321 RepID=A0AAY4A4V4_9TELE